MLWRLYLTKGMEFEFYQFMHRNGSLNCVSSTYNSSWLWHVCAFIFCHGPGDCWICWTPVVRYKFFFYFTNCVSTAIITKNFKENLLWSLVLCQKYPRSLHRNIFLNLPVTEHFLSVWLSDEKECVTMSHLLPVGEPKYILLSRVKQRPAQKIIQAVTVNT
jgi:hypothetical protein